MQEKREASDSSNWERDEIEIWSWNFYSIHHFQLKENLKENYVQIKFHC